MRFTEINLLGVYVAPISPMMVTAWMVTIALRRSAARFGLLPNVWHLAMVVFAVYMIVLSTIVLAVTLATVAVVLGRAMWDAYMGAPWTRDGTVRVYVVTKAPEVAGRIIGLPVKDNQFLHKGDLLMVIDPTDYKIAVSLNEAAVQQAQANALNAEREAQRRQELTTLAVTVEEKQTFSSNAVAVQADQEAAVAHAAES